MKDYVKAIWLISGTVLPGPQKHNFTCLKVTNKTRLYPPQTLSDKQDYSSAR